MLFNSFSFFILLFCLVPVYFGIGRSGSRVAQIGALLLASLVFYGWGQLALLPLLLISSLVNSLGALYVARRVEKAKVAGAVIVIFNLLILLYYKYWGLFLSAFLPELPEGAQSIPLPVGISFYTFQGISLIVDLQREESLRARLRQLPLLKGLLEMVTYIVFFPQLVAGPIVKAKSFLPQFQLVKLSQINFPLVMKYLIVGFFFKMVVADNLKDFTNFLTVDGFPRLSSGDLVLALYGYSFQIYADFMGYSTIAIGLGLLFGYRFPFNFNFPYIAASFSEFWTRWHISLSTWLKEYLYFPLGGNRKGSNRTLVNLMIVMLLGGLWHGAGWNYLIWGAGHGLCLVVERLLSAATAGMKGKFIRWMKRLLVFHCVTFLWLFFILPDFQSFTEYFQALGKRSFAPSPNIVFGVILFSIPVILHHLAGLCQVKGIHFDKEGLIREDVQVGGKEALLLGLLLALILLNSGSSGAFIYFQF